MADPTSEPVHLHPVEWELKQKQFAAFEEILERLSPHSSHEDDYLPLNLWDSTP